MGGPMGGLTRAPVSALVSAAGTAFGTTTAARTVDSRGRGSDFRDRGSGTVLALALGLVLIITTVVVLVLARSAIMATRAAAAADLAALAAADAARGISAGEPCVVAAEVARRHHARMLSCFEGADESVQVRMELMGNTMFGPAGGLARAGPPPAVVVP